MIKLKKLSNLWEVILLLVQESLLRRW